MEKMKRCVIFCAGGFEKLICPIEQGDFVIAADGGVVHTQTLGITPNIVMGDFDSLGYIPKGAQVFPVEKDDTDSMLAIKKGLALGYREFLLYGCLDGSRVDHTMANFQGLLFLKNHGASGVLVGLKQIATVFQNESVTFPADFRGNFSLFCMGEDACGVSLQNLKYNLQGGSLSAGFPLGVSNSFTGESALVTVEKGSLLALWDTENGLIPCISH